MSAMDLKMATTKYQLLQMSVALTISVFFLADGVLFACQMDDHLDSRVFDAAAGAWVGELDIYCDFEYQKHISSPQKALEVSATARGAFVMKNGEHKTTLLWSPLEKESAIYPEVSFEHSNGNGVEITLIHEGKVRIAPDHPTFERPIANLASKLSISDSRNRGYLRTYPIKLAPNVFGFCGGWNKGVVFGGLELSPKTAVGNKEHYEKYGYTDSPSDAQSQIKLFKPSIEGDEIELAQVKKLHNGTSIHRTIRFRDFHGLPLKINELYELKDAQGKNLHVKSINASSFIDFENTPVPLVLSIEEEYFETEKKIARLFRIDHQSIRHAKENDFEFDLLAAENLRLNSVGQTILKDTQKTSVYDLNPKEIQSVRFRSEDKVWPLAEPKGNRKWHNAIRWMVDILIGVFLVLTLGAIYVTSKKA